MNQIMLMTKAAAASMTQPSKMSGLKWGVGEDDGDGDAGGDGGAEGPEDGALELGAADLGEVGEDDPDDQGGFDAFAEGDDKCLQHNVFLFSGAERRRGG